MTYRKIQLIANFFAVLGYLSLAFQWLWALILFLPWLLNKQEVSDMLYPAGHATPPVADSSITISPFLAVVFTVLSIVIVAGSLFLAAKLPKKAIASTSRATEQAALEIVKVSTAKNHKKLTKKQRLSLTQKMMFYLKMTAVLLAAILIVCSVAFLPLEIDDSLALAIGLVLTLWPPIWFGVQYLIVTIWGKNKVKMI